MGLLFKSTPVSTIETHSSLASRNIHFSPKGSSKPLLSDLSSASQKFPAAAQIFKLVDADKKYEAAKVATNQHLQAIARPTRQPVTCRHVIRFASFFFYNPVLECTFPFQQDNPFCSEAKNLISSSGTSSLPSHF